MSSLENPGYGKIKIATGHHIEDTLVLHNIFPVLASFFGGLSCHAFSPTTAFNHWLGHGALDRVLMVAVRVLEQILFCIQDLPFLSEGDGVGDVGSVTTETQAIAQPSHQALTLAKVFLGSTLQDDSDQILESLDGDRLAITKVDTVCASGVLC